MRCSEVEGAVHVFTMADDAYSMPLAVMVRSLLEHYRSPRRLSITVADGGISAANRVRLEQSWSDVIGSHTVSFVPPRYPQQVELPVRGRMQPLTYSRLTLPEYYPAGVGRALLLDADLLVLRDVALLHDTELGQCVLAAARDPYIPSVASPGGLNGWRSSALPPDLPYFNAGVFTADLERWRAARVTERAFEYVQRVGPRLRLFDQDALNATLHGCWQPVDSRWQVHPRTRWSLGIPVPPDPWIVHFSGSLKPWTYASPEPVDRLYFDVLDRTAWRGTRPPRTLRALALRLYDSPLRRLLYPLEVRAGVLLRDLTPARPVPAAASRT